MMPDYRKLYFQLFGAVSDAIALLQQAQIQSEEEYLAKEKADLLSFSNKKEETEDLMPKE